MNALSLIHLTGPPALFQEWIMRAAISLGQKDSLIYYLCCWTDFFTCGVNILLGFKLRDSVFTFSCFFFLVSRMRRIVVSQQEMRCFSVSFWLLVKQNKTPDDVTSDCEKLNLDLWMAIRASGFCSETVYVFCFFSPHFPAVTVMQPWFSAALSAVSDAACQRILFPSLPFLSGLVPGCVRP